MTFKEPRQSPPPLWLAAVNATGVPLKEQTIVICGFGSAGIGIANLILTAMNEAGLSNEQARKRFYAVDRYGLLVERRAGYSSGPADFVRKSQTSRMDMSLGQREVQLLDVVRNAKATVLLGVSGQPRAFTEDSFAKWRSTRTAP